MSGRLYHRSLLLAVLLCLSLPVAAQPVASVEDAAAVQVFSAVSRTVVAVGVTFVFEVEVYASPASRDAAVAIERAVRAAAYRPDVPGLHLVREESTVSEYAGQGAHPLVVVRRFVLKVSRPGLHRLPPFRFGYGGQTYSTPVRQVTGYAVDPGFIAVSKAVVPVVAERGRRGGRQPGFARIGSAFLIAPDALVTNLHVVMDARRIWVTLPGGKRLVTRKAWAIDPVRDVAILYVDPKAVARAGLVPLDLAPDAGAVPAQAQHDGEHAVAFTYGWPGGTQRSTAGLRYHGAMLQPGETLWISANPVRPGDSGGPLLDLHGRVLGVVSAGTVGGDQPEALRQEVCIAVDVRPALAQKLLRGRPRLLRTLLQAPGLAAHPYAQAIRLTTLLAAGHRVPALETALAQLDTATEDGQDNARLHFQRGVIHQLLGTHRSAAEAYRTSLTIFEGNFLAAYMLAQHHLQRREYTEAERLFRHTVQYEPYAYFATYGLARTLVGRLRYAEAVPLLRAVLAHDPAYAPAYYELALSLFALGDERRARQLAAKLDGISPVRARQLRYVLRQPLLQPRVPYQMPRAAIKLLPPHPGARGPGGA